MKIISLQKKIVLVIGVVLLLLFITTSVLMSLAQRQLLITSHKESLQMLANEKSAQIEMFLESQKEKLEIIASMNVFKQAVLYPNDPAVIATAKDRINELKNIIPRIALFTSEGIMFIAESGPVPIDYSTIPYFVSKDKKIIFMRYYDTFQKKDYYSILGPMYDEVEKNKVIGAIAFDIELDKISTLMKETLDSKTNEVYLIDETGILLSGSKYIGKGNKNGILIQEVKSDGVKACLADLKKYKKDGTIEDHEEAVFQYINYMGDEVFGAHAYVPSIMGCVIAEEGKGEILGVSMGEYIKNMFQKKEADYEN